MTLRGKQLWVSFTTVSLHLDRESTHVLTLHLVGQTPKKLFREPHPERLNHGLSTLPLGTLHGIEEDPHLLVQNERCYKGT